QECLVVPREVGEPRIARAILGLAPCPKRQVLDGEERRLVRPPLGPAIWPRKGHAIELGLVIASEPGVQRQVVAALEYVDGVELQETEPAHGRLEPPTSDGRGRSRTEPLGPEEDASRLPGRHTLHLPRFHNPKLSP